MTASSEGLTIGELESGGFLYRKALKQLLLEGAQPLGLKRPWSGAGSKPCTTAFPASTRPPIRFAISAARNQRERTAAKRDLSSS